MMDIRKLCMLGMLLLVAGCTSNARTIDTNDTPLLSIEELGFLAGKWQGELEYLNYGDDKTLVKLPTRVSYSEPQDSISYQLIFTEPNGDEIEGSGSIKIEDERVIYNGASHKVVDRTQNEAEGTQIKLSRQGKDNNRDAQIDHVIHYKDDSLSITRYILLEGAEAPFVRHTYRFNRAE